MKKFVFPLLVFLIFACEQKRTIGGKHGESNVPSKDDTIQFVQPKNIILMIGDGMGLTQITAGMYLNGNKLNLEQFKCVGLHKSYAADNLVTDSAAGATAFSCGEKTYNGAIGVDKRGKPIQTILEEVEKKGKSTGIVVTCSMTHATPGSFYAHQKDREMVEEIAADLPGAGIDFFVGGGKKHFDRRKDEQNIIEQLTDRGYVINTYLDQELKDLTIDPARDFGYFTADAEPLPVAQGRDYLVPACKAAIKYLSQQPENGFFLMVEGSQIDWGGHSNNSDYITSEMIDFDNAVGAILDFAKKDGQTLVIVTADHETGGYAINPTSTMDSIVAAFTTKQHTASLIPVFAWGPGEQLFSGIYENTSIFDKMRRALGYKKPR